MFHSRKLNSRVNKLREKALRIAYPDYAFSFTELISHIALLSSVQESIEIEGWLLLTFFIYLHNQLIYTICTFHCHILESSDV